MDRRTWSIQALNAVGIVGAVAIIFGLYPVFRRWIDFPVELLMGVAWALAFAALVWRKMDETAREAHKNAWFWGGSFGFLLALLGLIAAFRMDPRPALLLRFSRQPVWLMVDGATIAGGAACAGYAVVWTVWWLRRR
ncbi:MAG TPA: hypothetical protein VKQ54_00100 [Caulobacteraceae bacterium]|nr:hypothetical protein [Caulobacteraceae bacterium]